MCGQAGRVLVAAMVAAMVGHGPVTTGAERSERAEGSPGERGGGEREVVASTGHVVIAMGNQSSRRRRRRRPKTRRGHYKVIEVTNGGRIEGVVVYNGPVPEPERIQIVKDHETCDRRSKKRDRIRVDAQKHVEGVVVFLGDIHEGVALPEREKPAITQHSCTFVPHVQVLFTKEKFDVVNEDPVAHNAKCAQSMMTLFNPMQPKQGMRNEFSIKRPGLATITCAVHNWMRAYAYVLWHPYYAITGEDGTFRIENVPPGEYELVAWQEHLGERSTTIVVEPGKTTRLEFDLTQQP